MLPGFGLGSRENWACTMSGPRTGHSAPMSSGRVQGWACPVVWILTNGHVPRSGTPRGMSLSEKWPPPEGRPLSRCYFMLATAKPQGTDSPGTAGN